MASKDVFDRSPLHAAAENGHVTCVEQLCVSEPGHVNDRDERGLTPLHLAARENHRYVSIIGWKYSLHFRLVFFLALLSRRTLSLASLGRDTYLIAINLKEQRLTFVQSMQLLSVGKHYLFIQCILEMSTVNCIL